MKPIAIQLLVLAACSVGAAPVSRSDHDASNPRAPEGQPLFAAPVVPSSSVDEHAIYTCPMHPEVESHAPGRCPKCGMDLVKR